MVFIAENGGGGGARLKFSREEVWEVNRWEDEGGVAGEDDILIARLTSASILHRDRLRRRHGMRPAA